MQKEHQESLDEDYSSFLNEDEADDEDNYSSEETETQDIDEEDEAETENTEEESEVEAESDILDIDGEKVKLDDLKSVYKNSVEYEKLTNEVSDFKERVVERASNIQRVYDNLNSYIQSLIPPEPSMDLLQRNPTEFLLAQETRKKIISELDSVIKQRNQAAEDLEQINQEDFLLRKSKSEAKFKNRLPEFKSESKLKEFYDNFKEIGSELGFSHEEIEYCDDHRLWELIHYASIGKKAVKAKKEFNFKMAEKRIASKPLRKTTNQFVSTNNNHSKHKMAFDRLKKTGNISDALKLDFD